MAPTNENKYIPSRFATHLTNFKKQRKAQNKELQLPLSVLIGLQPVCYFCKTCVANLNKCLCDENFFKFSQVESDGKIEPDEIVRIE